ncbi:MAG: M48 family metallopeptidase [Thermodesulfobacteriota bacterium]
MTKRQTMDFLQHQERARFRTLLLLVLFLLALAGTTVSLYFVVILVKPIIVATMVKRFESGGFEVELWQPDLMLFSIAAVLVMVVGETLVKFTELSGGGKRVAELLGAETVPPDPLDQNLRRFRNVVEEMAVAAGIPAPGLYVNPQEAGINAFAAGFTPQDAVICVTRGALENLSRDELQGVIAHEFSHIVNDDMRLNTRLIGALHGVLAIGLLGSFFMYSAKYGRGKLSAPLIAVGFLLYAAGFTGLFFTRLIKAAVSRQREFLADADAVQLTRNPNGLANALARISTFSDQSRIYSPRAEEISHLFFANALSRMRFSGMATHPPIGERIRRIVPAYFSEDYDPGLADLEPSPDEGESGFTSNPQGGGAGLEAARIMEAAQEKLASLSPALAEASHAHVGAQAVLICLLLNPDPETRRGQLEEISDPVLATEVARLLSAADRLAARYRIPLADRAFSSLAELSAARLQGFSTLAGTLCATGNRMSSIGFLTAARLRNIAPRPDVKETTAQPRFSKPAEVADELGVILSCLAWQGTDDPDQAREAFRKGLSQLPLRSTKEVLAARPEDFSAFSYALSQAALAQPELKAQIITACSACVLADNKVTAGEAELLHAISGLLGCPPPPILADVN